MVGYKHNVNDVLLLEESEMTDIEEKANEKVKKMLHEIYLKAVEEVDAEASFQHYLVQGWIKVIRKKENG